MTIDPLAYTHQPASAWLNDTALRADWDRLNDARLGLPFLTADAMAAALTVFGSGQEHLVCARRDGRMVAMAILLPQGRWRWVTFNPSQVPLGAWVAEPGIELDALARGMLRGGLPAWGLALSFSQVDPRQAERAADAADNRSDDYIPTSWLEVGGDFEAYWAQRGKNLRQNMRKQRNKLAADGIQATMRTWRGAGEMADALVRYGQMESTGWKASQGTAIHPDNDQGRFYLRLFKDAATRGEALITEYLFDERTVAMNLSLLRHGTLVVLKTTYDESISKAISPASLLREDELQSFFGAEEVRRIEYYGRTMDWHTKLTESQRTLYHLTTYRWPWLKALAERRRLRAEAAQAAEAARTVPEAGPQAAATRPDTDKAA